MEDRLDALEEMLGLLRGELDAARREIASLRSHVVGTTGLRPLLQRVEQLTEALVRRTTIDPAGLPAPERLVVQRFHLHSQGGEDGVIQALLAQAGDLSRRCVELGCGCNGGNSGFLVEELGWTGLMVDASADIVRTLRHRWRPRGVEVKRLWIRREDIGEHLVRWGYGGPIDLLSIDVDGNDIWIWEALDVCDPLVVAIEYNSALGADRSVAVPYDPDFARDKDVAAGLYYGASLPAVARVGARKGYRLVGTTNVNAFFVRHDVAPEMPEVSAERAWRLPAKDERRLNAVDGDPFDAFAEAGLQLVDVP